MTLDTDLAVQTTLGELLGADLFTDGDWVESKDQDPNGEVRLVQLADVGDGVFRDRSSRFLTLATARELGCTFLEPGDVLVARMPEPLGRACIFPGVGRPAVTAVDVCILRPNPARVRPEWLVGAINSPAFRASMQQLVRGTTRQRISRKNLATLSLPVPPLSGQLATAAALEAAQQKTASATGRLGAAGAALTQFRQAVLATACTGGLTTTWRSRTATSAVVAATVADRQEAPRNRRATRNRAAMCESQPKSQLPEGWTWTQLRQVASSIEYGYTASSTREAVGPKMLRVTDIQDDAVDWAAVPYCLIDASHVARFRLARGDLLFARTGATTGKSYLLRDDPPDSVFASYLIRVRLDKTVSPDYVYAFFRSPLYWRQVGDASVGTGQPNVNGTKLANLWIPVPTAAEQVEIARRVDELLKLEDRLSTRIAAAVQRVGRTSQALQAKAFRGELGLNGSNPIADREAV